MLRFLCSCSYLFTFVLYSQFYWHIRLKSTAYFFDPPRRYGSSWGGIAAGNLVEFPTGSLSVVLCADQ